MTTDPPPYERGELDWTSSPSTEAEQYADHVLRLTWLRGSAWCLFDLKAGDLGLRVAGCGLCGDADLGAVAAALLDHADALQVLSDYPGPDQLGNDVPDSEMNR